MHRYFLPAFVLFFLLEEVLGRSGCLRPIQADQNNQNKFKTIEGIETGHLTILSKDSSNGTATRPFRKPHLQNKINLVISLMFIKGFADDSTLYIQVNGTVEKSSFKVVFSYSPTTKWVSVHTHYLIASREQVRCGSIIMTNEQLKKPTDSSKPKIFADSYVIKDNGITPESRMFSYAFISALKSKSKDLYFLIDDSTFTYRDQSLNLKVKMLSANAIQKVVVSYVLVAYPPVGGPPTAPPSSTPRKVLTFQPFLNSLNYLYQLINTINFEKPGIVGIKGFNGSALSQLKQKVKGRLLEQDPKFNNILGQIPLQFISVYKKAFILQQLEIISNQFLQPIVYNNNPLTNSSIQKLINQGKCFTSSVCEEFKGIITILDGQPVCVICQNNSVFNPECEMCQCIQGYVSNGQNCVSVVEKCGQGRIFKGNQCYQLLEVQQFCSSFNQIYDQVTKRCICKQGYIEKYSINGQTYCIKQCPQGAIYNILTYQCQCPLDSHLFNNNCIFCGELYIWDQQLQKCMCKNEKLKDQNGNCKYHPNKKPEKNLKI